MATCRRRSSSRRRRGGGGGGSGSGSGSCSGSGSSSSSRRLSSRSLLVRNGSNASRRNAVGRNRGEGRRSGKSKAICGPRRG